MRRRLRAISAGTRYWFAFTSFPFDFSFWWDQNDEHVTGGEFSSFDLSTLGTGVSSVDGLTPGIELDSAVPEPSSRYSAWPVAPWSVCGACSAPAQHDPWTRPSTSCFRQP